MNFDTIDLNLLRVFDVLMRERSVTLAAEHLCRTQSAISHSLAKLRELFDDQLFIRDGGMMKPTPRAIELSIDTSAALTKIRTTIDRHQRFDPAETRRNFKIGLTDYHAMIITPGLIKIFSEQAPYATLNVIPTSKNDVSALIHSRQIDCAIMGNFGIEDPSLYMYELAHERLVCALWSGSADLHLPLSLDSYLAATHIQISSDGLSEGMVDRFLKERGLRRTVAATVPNYLLIPWILRGTNLITLCGESILLLLAPESEITLVPPPLALPKLSLCLIQHAQMKNDPATIWFGQVIEKICSAWSAAKEHASGISQCVWRPS